MVAGRQGWRTPFQDTPHAPDFSSKTKSAGLEGVLSLNQGLRICFKSIKEAKEWLRVGPGRDPARMRKALQIDNPAHGCHNPAALGFVQVRSCLWALFPVFQIRC